MKKSFFLLTAAILFFTIACSENQTTKPVIEDETIQLLRHSRFHGECIGYCERYMDITKDSTKLIMKGWDGLGHKLGDTVVASFKTAKNTWDSLTAAFTMDSFMTLDSIYPPLGPADEGHTTIYVKASSRTKSTAFTEPDTMVAVIQKLNDKLWELRNFYGIDTMKVNK